MTVRGHGTNAQVSLSMSLNRLFLTIGILVVLAGIASIWLFSIPKFREGTQSNTWQQTTATIIESRAETTGTGDDRKVTLVIKYLYSASDIELIGDRVTVFSVQTDMSKQALTRKYRVGSTPDAYFNPEKPWRVVLEPGNSIAALFFIPSLLISLGALFVLLPALSMRKEKRAREEAHSSNQHELGTMPAVVGRDASGCFTMLGGFIMLIGFTGGLVAILFMMDDAESAAASEGWPPSPAMIETSAFKQSISGPASRKTYTGQVTYRYTVDGTEYHSSQVFPSFGEPDKMAGYAQAVYEYRPGMPTEAFVNPNDPAVSVLTPASQKKTWALFSAFLAVPIGFILIGRTLLSLGLMMRRRHISHTGK